MGSKIFVVHMAIREQKEIPVHSKKQAQVKALIFDKAPIEDLAEYSDYNNIFLADNVVEFLKNTEMNEYAIKLEEDK